VLGEDLLPAGGGDILRLALGEVILLVAGGDILMATGDITITTEILLSFSQAQ
jgi:hypothetical protein